jgi:hypothetical protein
VFSLFQFIIGDINRMMMKREYKFNRESSSESVKTLTLYRHGVLLKTNVFFMLSSLQVSSRVVSGTK